MGCEISRVIGRHFSRKNKVGVINEDSELAKRMMGPAVIENNSEEPSDVKEADMPNQCQQMPVDSNDKLEEYELQNEEGNETAVIIYTVKPAESCIDNTDIKSEKTDIYGNDDVPVRVQRVRPKAAKGPRAMPRSSSSFHWSRHLFTEEEPQQASLQAALGDCSPFLDKRMRPKAAKGCRTPMWVESTGFEVSSVSRQMAFSDGDLSLWDNRLKEKSQQQRALEAWSKRVQERE